MTNEADTKDLSLPHPSEDDSGKRSYKRRKVIVKRSFQIRYALVILALFGLAAFMVWWETYQSLRGLAQTGIIQDPQILPVLTQINHVVLIKMIVALGLVWGLSVLLSHYLAGPLYRIEVGLKGLCDGDLAQEMRLRQFDELKPLAALFNETIGTLRDQVKEDRQTLEEAVAQIERVALSVSGDERRSLGEVAQRLREVGRFFKLP